MQIDTIKAVFTYATALIIILAGFGFLFFYVPPAGDNGQAASALLAVTGLMGGASTFLFSAEVATRATRAASASTAAGAAASTANGASGTP